eukprot:CAMPEP_0184289836 /NCGR_PEP_ID=MMETSP1049-20130417/2203_1 /TAXON_ID=77928 /ORGANISM="Proteomonas sulcata, Strain CCMP704" /LENGTH=235 /DNA_ID=CAMNT_0026596779 /DNA_START=20 /DNA_END=727 /DNA_ORIENTATION=-
MAAVAEVVVSSFSFKTGLPPANLVLDVRFLPDPRQLEEEDPYLTGKHNLVEDFIKNHGSFEPFWRQLQDKVLFLLHEFSRRGHSKVGLAFGCTAGKHRSVFVAEALANWLREQMQGAVNVQVLHRDMHAFGEDMSDVVMKEVEALDASNPAPGPVMKCTYHPETKQLDVQEVVQQKPEPTSVCNMLGSGLKNMKLLKERRKTSRENLCGDIGADDEMLTRNTKLCMHQLQQPATM